jgi:hypothetical protein
MFRERKRETDSGQAPGQAGLARNVWTGKSAGF